MDTTAIDLKEGDIYRWRYRAPSDERPYGSYHCCSCIAVVRGERLRDTFWGSSAGSDGKSFGLDDLHKIDLTYVGNFADLDKAPDYRASYYDDSDVVNLNHSNSGRDNFYLRKGAKRSAAKMLESAYAKIEKARSDIRLAEWQIEQANAAIDRIEAGELDAVHL